MTPTTVNAVLMLTFLSAPPTTKNAENVVSNDSPASKKSPVILAQSGRKSGRKSTGGKRPGRRSGRKAPKNSFIDTYWNIFTPPGNYNFELGVGLGVNYLNTAFGGNNPNTMLRIQGTYRPIPNQPLSVYGAVDGNIYDQTAGPLAYQSTAIMFAAGGGAQIWYYGMRFDALAEVGLQTRVATQTDGNIEPITTFGATLGAGLWTGVAFSLGGHIAASFKLGARYHSLRSLDFSDARTDYMVLYGLEYMIGGKPWDPY